MSRLVGTRIIQPVVPNDSADNYPTHKESYGEGGYKSVSSLAERDVIAIERQKVGMAVYVVDLNQIYILMTLSSSLTDDNWTTLQISGSSGIIVSPTTPEVPTEGMLWLNTNSGDVLIFSDGRWEIFVYKSEMSSSDGNLTLNGGYF